MRNIIFNKKIISCLVWPGKFRSRISENQKRVDKEKYYRYSAENYVVIIFNVFEHYQISSLVAIKKLVALFTFILAKI
jgi:hypothetical protein